MQRDANQRWLWISGILVLALAVRLVGISAESFWSDEAFTASASEGSVAEILERNARDIHPPAYYLGLSLWRGVLPDFDVTMRAYSSAWSLLGILILILFASEIAGWRCALVAGLFAALNPLDVYFAQEARMYSQATSLGLLSAWSLWRWCEASRLGERGASCWRWGAGYAASSALLLLTHYVAITFLVGQGLVALAFFASRRDWKGVAGYLLSAAVVALAFLPWLLYVLTFRDSIVRGEGLLWMPFPGLTDYFSFLGREYFWGRARTLHDQWWILTLLLPIVVIGAGAWKSFGPMQGERPWRSWLYLAGHIVAPLLICAVVCLAYQVVYYRPRYVSLLLPYFLVILSWSCLALGRRVLVATAIAVVASAMAVGSGVQQVTPQKHEWRQTAAFWPEVDAPAFHVILPERHAASLSHYLDGPVRHTPRRVLEKLSPLPEGALIWVAHWPQSLAPEDADYREWLKGVGDARFMHFPSHYLITQVEPAGGYEPPAFAAERFHRWYRPFDIQGGVGGFSDASRFERLAFDPEGEAYRWSASTAWLRFDDVRAGEELVLRAAPVPGQALPDVHLKRGTSVEGLFEEEPQFTAGDPVESDEIRLVAPPGIGSLWVGWTPPASRAGADPDERGLRVEWVGIAREPESAQRMARRDE